MDDDVRYLECDMSGSVGDDVVFGDDLAEVEQFGRVVMKVLDDSGAFDAGSVGVVLVDGVKAEQLGRAGRAGRDGRVETRILDDGGAGGERGDRVVHRKDLDGMREGGKWRERRSDDVGEDRGRKRLVHVFPGSGKRGDDQLLDLRGVLEEVDTRVEGDALPVPSGNLLEDRAEVLGRRRSPRDWVDRGDPVVSVRVGVLVGKDDVWDEEAVRGDASRGLHEEDRAEVSRVDTVSGTDQPLI